MQKLQIPITEFHLIAPQGAVTGACLIHTHRTNVDTVIVAAMPGNKYCITLIPMSGVVTPCYFARISELTVTDIAVDLTTVSAEGLIAMAPKAPTEEVKAHVGDLVVPAIGHVVPRSSVTATAIRGTPVSNDI